MECYAQPPLQRGEWELLYDHSQLCEALVQEGAPVAKALFALRVEQLTSRGGGSLPDETAIILLTSLNRSLYDYLLFQLGISFSRCCYDNRLHAHAGVGRSAGALQEAGDAILDAYAEELRRKGARVRIEPIPYFPVSSTDVRKALENDGGLEGLVPPAVESYIRVHQVYDFRKGLQA